jgi:hypothetical protein
MLGYMRPVDVAGTLHVATALRCVRKAFWFSLSRFESWPGSLGFEGQPATSWDKKRVCRHEPGSLPGSFRAHAACRFLRERKGAGKAQIGLWPARAASGPLAGVKAVGTSVVSWLAWQCDPSCKAKARDQQRLQRNANHCKETRGIRRRGLVLLLRNPAGSGRRDEADSSPQLPTELQ